jgi:lipopolysaccharide transport system permease protein
MGVAWFLASIGVFVRDVGQTIGIVTTIMLFLSPVFYPVSVLPAHLRPLMLLNPLTFVIEQVRSVLIWGGMPDWSGLAVYSLLSVGVAWTGFSWFQKMRKGFADVL